jgi:hypothetical protein
MVLHPIGKGLEYTFPDPIGGLQLEDPSPDWAIRGANAPFVNDLYGVFSPFFHLPIPSLYQHFSVSIAAIGESRRAPQGAHIRSPHAGQARGQEMATLPFSLSMYRYEGGDP